jgi:dynein heavy chain
MTYVVGVSLLSAAALSYIGSFTSSYRQQLINQWVDTCNAKKVTLPARIKLAESMSTALQIHEWSSLGLPSDQLSVENAIISQTGKRWPLMIDPQGQANRWIKNLESTRNLIVVQLSDPDFLRTLQNGVRLGYPILIEHIGEQLPPILEPILLKQTFFKASQELIIIGDYEIPYNNSFRLYMTTKLENPHYLPEGKIIMSNETHERVVHIRACVINFSVTSQGLTDQLLVEVVRNESPELEKNKEKLVIEIAADKKLVIDINTKILALLNQSKGDILDDEELIDTLEKSEVTSKTIKKRLQESEETETRIDANREEYRSVASHGTILYFTIASLFKVKTTI